MKTRIVVMHAKRPTFHVAPTRAVPREDYVEVTSIYIEAEHEAALEAAYGQTQNLDSAWRAAAPCRSTSVGDVLVVQAGASSRAFEVAPLGFELIELT